MYSFTQAQQRKALFYLVFFHMLVIASSNYLVQFPFTIMGCHTTWGAFTFPFIFLTTDLTIRIFGAELARKIIFAVMIPALALSYLISVVFFAGDWQGLSQLSTFNFFVFRIALASFSAYLVGQLMDITVFNSLRKNKRWWLAPSVSAIVGNGIDTFVFFSMSFYNSANVYMVEHWLEIAIMDYLFKLIICSLFFLPLYGILLTVLLWKLTQIKEAKQSVEITETPAIYQEN